MSGGWGDRSLALWSFWRRQWGCCKLAVLWSLPGGQPVFVRGCYPVSRVATARGPGSAARLAAWHGAICPLRQPLPAPSCMLPTPLSPTVLPCLSVCHLAGVNCTLLLEHLVLDNLWIIANSR